MTDNTQPEALTYERDRAIMEGERNASLDAYSRVVLLTSAESRLYEAAFTNGWNRCAAHVQNPAEIEHVAGDVSKNGAGLDMTQQPVAQQGAASEPTPPKGEELRALSDRYWGREDLRDAHAAGVACGFALGGRALRTQQPCPTAPAAPALTQGAAIAAGAVYAELPDDVIDYVKGSYAFLQSTAPDGYAEEVFSLPPSATRNQRSLQDALQSDKHGWHPAAARQDSGDGKRSGPDAGVSASHGQAQAASSEVLKAIREANMQLVRTGDDVFMLVPYKVATAQADSQTTLPEITAEDRLFLHYNPNTGDIVKWVHNYARAAVNADRAARAPADSMLEDAARYQWLFGARTEAQSACVSETVFKPLPQDEVLSHLQGFYMSKAVVDALVDAARKQGAIHE